MSIFIRELRAHYKGLIGWSIGMTLLIVSSMAKLGNINSSGQSVNELLEAFPKPIMVIFGLSGFDLNTTIGYFGVTFLYIALMAAIHAAMIGSEIVSREERDRTAEFLIPKPVSRNRIVTEKLAAALVNLFVVNVVATLTSVWSVEYFAKGSSLNNTIYLMMAGLALMQLLFFSLRVFFAGILKNPKLPAIAATSVLLVTYIMWVIIDLNTNFENLKYFTPFKYFDARAMIDSGHLDPLYVTISAVLIVVLISIGYVVYNKRDLKV